MTFRQIERIPGYHFTEAVIEKLRRIAWWNWSSEQLAGCREDMQGEVAEFAEKYDAPLELLVRRMYILPIALSVR